MDRRNFLTTSTTAVLGSSTALAATPLITSDAMRPQMAHGVQSGDPQADGAIIWTRSDRPARLWLDWSTTASMANATRVRGPFMLEDSDYTGHLRLPAAALGGTATRNVRFAWSGDTAGQGWGINEAWGGMKIYEQMRQVRPDFFLHCGDTIYADGPITAQVKLADGSMWNNIVTEEVSKVAESLNEFRGRYRYNLMDANVRRMAAEVPQIWQWDDHEVTNNWSDAKDLAADKRYTEKNLPLLTARATKAFLEYAPLRRTPDVESERARRWLWAQQGGRHIRHAGGIPKGPRRSERAPHQWHAVLRSGGYRRENQGYDRDAERPNGCCAVHENLGPTNRLMCIPLQK